MENKERPKHQALSRDTGPDMNADGELAWEVSENNDVEYVNEVDGSTLVMRVRIRITLGVCQRLKNSPGNLRQSRKLKK